MSMIAPTPATARTTSSRPIPSRTVTKPFGSSSDARKMKRSAITFPAIIPKRIVNSFLAFISGQRRRRRFGFLRTAARALRRFLSDEARARTDCLFFLRRAIAGEIAGTPVLAVHEKTGRIPKDPAGHPRRGSPRWVRCARLRSARRRCSSSRRRGGHSRIGPPAPRTARVLETVSCDSSCRRLLRWAALRRRQWATVTRFSEARPLFQILELRKIRNFATVETKLALQGLEYSRRNAPENAQTRRARERGLWNVSG